jgi:hypothetical protein
MVFHVDHLTSINERTDSSGFAIHMRLDGGLDGGLDETTTSSCVATAPASFIFNTSRHLDDPNSPSDLLLRRPLRRLELASTTTWHGDRNSIRIDDHVLTTTATPQAKC